MAKHLILILLSLLLISCGARKVNVDKAEVISKTDSTSVTKKEEVTTQDNHINITEDIDELEVTPIDTSKCIEVDGKKYHNAKLRYKKTKKVLVDTTKIKVSKKASNEVILKKILPLKLSKKTLIKKLTIQLFGGGFWLFYCWHLVIMPTRR